MRDVKKSICIEWSVDIIIFVTEDYIYIHLLKPHGIKYREYVWYNYKETMFGYSLLKKECAYNEGSFTGDQCFSIKEKKMISRTVFYQCVNIFCQRL